MVAVKGQEGFGIGLFRILAGMRRKGVLLWAVRRHGRVIEQPPGHGLKAAGQRLPALLAHVCIRARQPRFKQHAGQQGHPSRRAQPFKHDGVVFKQAPIHRVVRQRGRAA